LIDILISPANVNLYFRYNSEIETETNRIEKMISSNENILFGSQKNSHAQFKTNKD